MAEQQQDKYDEKTENNDLNTIEGLNRHLTTYSYIGGYAPSCKDREMYDYLFGNNKKAAMWVSRMASYHFDELRSSPYISEDF